MTAMDLRLKNKFSMKFILSPAYYNRDVYVWCLGFNVHNRCIPHNFNRSSTFLHGINACPNETAGCTLWGIIWICVNRRIRRTFIQIIVTWCMHYKLHTRQQSWMIFLRTDNICTRIESFARRWTTTRWQEPRYHRWFLTKIINH